MHRRQFVQAGIAGGTSMLLGTTTSSCATASVSPRAVQYPSSHDPRLHLLSYALLAPSSHNAQPWRARLRGRESVDLFLDPSRLLPQVDPSARQALISHGTFLEAADQAARPLGYRCTIDLFPDGIPRDSSLGARPTARLRVRPSDGNVTSDALSLLRLRQTNKRPFEDKAIAPADVRHLLDQVQEPVAARAIVAPQQRAAIARLCRDAMQIEVASAARNQELSRWFRLGSAERSQAQDGFGLGQSGISGFQRWVAETFFVHREDMVAPDSGFSKKAIDITEEQAATARVFVVLATRHNDRISQLRVGFAYLRLHLAAARLGIQVHPLSQATQEYADMTALRQQLSTLTAARGETIQMLLRLGYANAVEHTPRRSTSSLLMTG